jgi:hypothetical protein
LPNCSRSSLRNSAGLRQSLYRIKWIEQPALVRRTGHELGNALRALTAACDRPYRIRLKAALLPDHAREEFQRETIGRCSGFDHQAHRLARIRRLLHPSQAEPGGGASAAGCVSVATGGLGRFP